MLEKKSLWLFLDYFNDRLLKKWRSKFSGVKGVLADTYFCPTLYKKILRYRVVVFMATVFCVFYRIISLIKMSQSIYFLELVKNPHDMNKHDDVIEGIRTDFDCVVSFPVL